MSARDDSTHNVLSNDPVDSGPRTPDRPTRYEVVARARNEIDGREEPATITVDEHQARLAGRIDFPDDGRARSHDDVQEERRQLLARVEREIIEERAQRADPDTARLVENRDQESAGGKFADAASYQRLIDKLRRDSAETEAHRENAARDAHGRFPFWADRDRPERGPTDRPGAHRRRGERPRRAREERQR